MRGTQRAKLRRKRDLSRSGGEVQRFYPESIASHEQRTIAAVPHRERKHAANPGEAVWTITRDKAQEHFGVAGRAEALAARLEVGAQGAVVVDLPVEDDGMSALGAEHRLRAAGARIDDGEPPVHEQDVGAFLFRRHPRAGAVWTAVR